MNLLLEITYSDGENKESSDYHYPTSLVYKISDTTWYILATLRHALRFSQKAMDWEYSKTETYFYCFFSKTIACTKLPHCFCATLDMTEQKGVIVMEDLSSLSHTITKYDGMDWSAFFLALRKLAQFHAQFWISEENTPQVEALRNMVSCL